MADRHLEAAESAYIKATGGDAIDTEGLCAAITAYLDSLLGELPEEVVKAARSHEQRGEGCDRITVIDTEQSVRRALQWLRDSLASG